ncbi:MAG: OmpW family outer membrane protein [Bdellovibrionales bacterium]|jgi:outer membrane protein|nr:OmpW family outer membrane protein [Bdellovibrionales bacterium]
MKRILRSLALVCCCCAGIAATTPAKADFNPHDWQLRLRTISISPDESSNVSPISGKVGVDAAIMPELDITYFINDNFSLELILATTKHDVKHSSGLDLGSVWVLPPTLTAQYRFNNQTAFVPYVGAGINYTIFYNADSGAANSIKYKNGFGYALQAGLDYKLDENWSLNLDVKKIFLDTEAKVNGGAVRANVDLDPWVFGAGVGYRF